MRVGRSWPRILFATLVALSVPRFALEAESPGPIAAHTVGCPHLNVKAPSVRPKNIIVGRLVEEGAMRSATFASEVCELAESDVVVYVDPPSALPSNVDAYLAFISTTSAKRYLIIRLSKHVIYPRIISLIGHELQHALEIARHPEVVDAKSLAAMYKKFGKAASMPASWDSDEAVQVGRVVERELVESDTDEWDEH